MSPTKVFISIARGDAEAHSIKQKAHQDVAEWLKKNGKTYGLPEDVIGLDDVQRETLQSLYEGENVSVTVLITFALDADECFASVEKVA
jgi:hypothetical protein